MELKLFLYNMLTMLNMFYEDNNTTEIGVDEAGRGPLFGRIYCAAVVLPKDNSFQHDRMKDSKKFHSEKKIIEVANYIKQNCIKYDVQWMDEKQVDHFNIRNATHKAMHNAINNIMDDKYNTLLLIDGNDFTPIPIFKNNALDYVPHVCIEGGDNKYTAIAAASILAKVERDKYIKELCEEHPYLNEKYGLLKNKGYGTKQHLNGIREHGITEWHRKTYGICKQFVHPINACDEIIISNDTCKNKIN